MIRKIIFLSIAMVCVSCVTNPKVGTTFDLNDANGMVPGQTTIEEAASESVNDPPAYQWRYPKPGGDTPDALAVMLFDDQEVMTKVYIWRSRTNTSNIDLLDVDKLVHNQTTFEEATVLLGLPNRARVRIDGSSVYWWHGSDPGIDRSTAAAQILPDDQGIVIRVQHQTTKIIGMQ